MSGANHRLLEMSQQIADVTHDAITPANVVSGLGFLAAVYGIRHLDSWRGIVLTGTGFAADVIDGRIARATDTATPLGEKIDATLDKVKMGYLAVTLLQEERAPKGLVCGIITQNSLNASITLYDQYRNEEQQVHPVPAGKYGMFAQSSGLGLHAVGSKLAESRPAIGKAVKTLGSIVGYSGIALSLLASHKYLSDAIKK